MKTENLPNIANDIDIRSCFKQRQLTNLTKV